MKGKILGTRWVFGMDISSVKAPDRDTPVGDLVELGQVRLG